MIRMSRRSVRRGQRVLVLGSVLVAVSLGSSVVASAAPATPATTPDASASAIADVVRSAMDTGHLRAVVVKVTQGDQVLISQAFGTSMDGVPATTDMHFRNGAVAFAYLGTLLMQFVDEHKVTLDDTIDHWMPELPEADQVTLKMLANQTTGYPDFETDAAWKRPGAPIHSTSGRSRSGSPTRSPARCSSLPERTGATRTPTS